MKVWIRIRIGKKRIRLQSVFFSKGKNSFISMRGWIQIQIEEKKLYTDPVTISFFFSKEINSFLSMKVWIHFRIGKKT